MSGDDATLSCRSVRWIDAGHLLCEVTGDRPYVLSVSDAVLTPAATYEQTASCSVCYGRQYVWVLPPDAVKPLVPKTQRALTGFTVGPGGLVYFLASAGKSYFLYSVPTGAGATPTKRGTITLPDGSAPDAAYLTLQWR